MSPPEVEHGRLEAVQIEQLSEAEQVLGAEQLSGALAHSDEQVVHRFDDERGLVQHGLLL